MIEFDFKNHQLKIKNWKGESKMWVSRKHIRSLENNMEILQEKLKSENKELQKKIDSLKIENGKLKTQVLHYRKLYVDEFQKRQCLAEKLAEVENNNS